MVNVSNKRIFLEALFLAGALFIFGLYFGFLLEQGNVEKLNKYYSDAQASIIDNFALSYMFQNANLSCNQMISSQVNFADKIYKESIILDNYEREQGLTGNINILHRKYNSMRTLLWVDSSEILKKCPNEISLIVYLYKYHSKDLSVQAKQKVWSNLLLSFKEKEGGKIILIPIAMNSNLSSLNVLLNKYNIKETPSIMINNKILLDNLTNLDLHQLTEIVNKTKEKNSN